MLYRLEIYIVANRGKLLVLAYFRSDAIDLCTTVDFSAFALAHATMHLSWLQTVVRGDVRKSGWGRRIVSCWSETLGTPALKFTIDGHVVQKIIEHIHLHRRYVVKRYNVSRVYVFSEIVYLLQNKSVLQRFPQVFLTAIALVYWFSGCVITKQTNRTYCLSWFAKLSSLSENVLGLE